MKRIGMIVFVAACMQQNPPPQYPQYQQAPQQPAPQQPAVATQPAPPIPAGRKSLRVVN